MVPVFKRWVADLKGEGVDWEEAEGMLIQADLGLVLTEKIISKLKKSAASRNEVREIVVGELLGLWKEGIRIPEFKKEEMNVWLVVGVNGTGKTTSIAKLAHWYGKKGIKVFFVAADTFRAAAVEQLNIWAERLGIGIFCGKEGGDPGAAVYEGLEAARKAGADLVLVDTAGRLHNRENLMRELEKVKRVIAKQKETGADEVVLVVDGMTGINGISQAKEFNSLLGVTGLVVTKLDSSAKGGVIAAIKEEAGIDTFFVGDGEGIEDLIAFDAEAYVKDFFGGDEVDSEEKEETKSSLAERSPVLRFLRGVKNRL